MIMNRMSALLCCVLLAAGLMTQSAQARWFFSKDKAEDDPAKQVQTYQPPSADSLPLYCEPYREEAALLYQKSFISRVVSFPRRMWLMKKHRQCIDELMTQEYEYLKHADIEQAPSLPKIKTEVQPINQPDQKTEGSNGGAK